MVEVRALVITAPHNVAEQRVQLPGAAASDVVVRVAYCGLCTPEQRVFRGAKPTYPYWGGHELSGVIERAGDAGAGLKAGDKVAVLLMQRCGHCHACRRGLDNHCAYLHPQVPADGPPGPGGLSDLISVPAYKVFRVAPATTLRTGALVEPVACVVRSLSRLRCRRGERAAVIGAGSMGLIHAALLVERGCEVWLFEDDADTYPAALKAGAATCLGLAALAEPATVRTLTDGWGFDVIACTRFGARGLELALRVAARGGRVVAYQSLTRDVVAQVDLNYLHYREIELIGSVAQSAMDVRTAVDLLDRSPQLLDPLSIEVISAREPVRAFETALLPQVNRVLVDLQPLAVA